MDKNAAKQAFLDAELARRDERIFRIYKGLDKIRWANEEEQEAELAMANNSAYYWWWEFLKLSSDYKMALAGKREEPYASMAKDFGELGDDFNAWWLKTGRNIFAEQQPLPAIRVLDHGVIVNLDQQHLKVALEIPLTIRREDLLKQFNMVLDQYHPGSGLRVYEHGTSKRRLYAESTIRLSTLALLHSVWTVRRDWPKADWYEIGKRLKISPSHLIAADDLPADKDNKRRTMTLEVQRYYRQAETVIKFAGQGVFPRLK